MTDEDIIEIATLVNHAWSEAAKVVMAVKAERDDGSSDWAAFHRQRLDAAVAAEAQANGLNFRYIAEHKAVIQRAFGL